MMVESFAALELVMVDMTKQEKDQIEQAKTGLGRSILGVGVRVSKRVVMRELGWVRW